MTDKARRPWEGMQSEWGFEEKKLGGECGVGEERAEAQCRMSVGTRLPCDECACIGHRRVCVSLKGG